VLTRAPPTATTTQHHRACVPTRGCPCGSPLPRAPTRAARIHPKRISSGTRPAYVISAHPDDDVINSGGGCVGGGFAGAERRFRVGDHVTRNKNRRPCGGGGRAPTCFWRQGRRPRVYYGQARLERPATRSRTGGRTGRKKRAHADANRGGVWARHMRRRPSPRVTPTAPAAGPAALAPAADQK